MRSRQRLFASSVLSILPLVAGHCGGRQQTGWEEGTGGATLALGRGGQTNRAAWIAGGDGSGGGGASNQMSTGIFVDLPIRYTCGDGRVEAGEECDDLNVDEGDGCSGVCRIEEGWECPEAGRCFRIAEHGDGELTNDEECEAGNVTFGDRGSADGGCCGDGIVNGNEECDQGRDNGGAYGERDRCTAGCRKTHWCGDGIIDGAHGEQCDDGARNGSEMSWCVADCRIHPQN